MSSGIYECGNNCNKEIIVTSLPPTITTEIINEIYAGSLYPTAAELIADEGLTYIRNYDGYDNDSDRFGAIETYIFDNYMCNQSVLFTIFPGPHYALACRDVPTRYHRASYGGSSRTLSEKAMEALTEATTRSAKYFSKFNSLGAGALHAIELSKATRKRKRARRSRSKYKTRRHR
jgi:hypothetical protein